jgi:hypothetical protein
VGLTLAIPGLEGEHKFTSGIVIIHENLHLVKVFIAA